jgi:ribosome recycling factor
VQVIEWLQRQYIKINSSRVDLRVFNEILVDAYEQKTPLNQLANLQLLDARTVLITPYDKTLVKDIVSAINQQNIGVNPINDVDKIRIPFPTITEETRQNNVKQAKIYFENAKNQIREIRQKVQNEFKKEINPSDTDKFSFEKELNNITKKYNEELETILSRKSQDLLTI